MARLHRSLSYEIKERKKLNLLVPYMSKKLFELEKGLGKKRVEEIVWSYISGITFRDTTKKELNFIKKTFGIGELDKKISEYGVAFTNSLNTGLKVDGKSVTLTIEFKWDLPETCKLDYETEWLEMDNEDVSVENGKVFRKETKVIVDCGEKEMMKSLFKSAEA